MVILVRHYYINKIIVNDYDLNFFFKMVLSLMLKPLLMTVGLVSI